MSEPRSETTDAMIADARAEARAKIKVAKALAKLPDDFTRRKVIRGAAILLNQPEAVGDRPNR